MHDESELIPTRRTLLSRLRDWNDQTSWKEFFDTYWKLIYKAARESGLTDAEAQDVVQNTVISVLKKMPEFEYNPQIGSFKNWLLKLTHWRIIDQVRKRSPAFVGGAKQSPETRRTGTIERIPDPAGSALEALWNEEWEKNLMDAAIERVKARVDPKQFQIFDLYVIKKMPVAKITQALKINAARVYLAKHRVLSMVRKEIKQLETEFV
jgi:RNA polymerase sigma factor (sigma-70 family)